MKRLSHGLLTFSSLLIASTLTGCAHEQKVTEADLPPAVKATLAKETTGGKVTESEKEMKGGKTVYSFDAEVGGKEWDIVIAEDGTLLSKDPE